MPQIIRLTSEALQATIRRLLPSQQGFGLDLEATNVIQPIIDLTPTAEGSQLPQSYAQALNFGDATAFSVNNGDSNVVSTPGFYRIFGGLTIPRAGTAQYGRIRINDGLGFKQIWLYDLKAGATNTAIAVAVDFIFFLDTGHSLNVDASADANFTGSVRQVADRYGNIQNPSGFTFE